MSLLSLLTVDATRVAAARTRGVRVRVRCTAACTVRHDIVAPASTARRLGLGRRAVRIGRRTVRLQANGRSAVRIRLSSRARRGLRGKRRVLIELRTRVTPNAGGAPQTARRRIALR